MEILKNVQIIFAVLFKHSLQIAIILTLICILNVFFNAVVLNDCTKGTDNQNNKEN